MRSLFLSDLHLQDNLPELTSQALSLLEYSASRFDNIYLLGDIFEYWIGDDAATETSHAIAASLAALSKRGLHIYLMRGNRDFLIGDQFAESCGAELIQDDQYPIDLGGVRSMLMHGDTLCSSDADYNMYRHMVRNRHWQEEFLAKSISDRIATAQAMRSASALHSQQQPDQGIGDVTDSTVLNAFEQFGVERIIHGHTHRPAVHFIDNGERALQRIVLGDWSADGAVVAISDNRHCKLQRWNGRELVDQ